MPDRDRDQRPARGGAREVGPDPADPPQEHRQGGLHRRAVALQAEEVFRAERRRGDRVRQPVVAPALHVRGVALRALPEMHGARQDRLDQGEGRAEDAGCRTGSTSMSTAIRRTRPRATKARKPLADAKVDVFADEENPGYYSARFYLRPHFQLEGMDIGLSLVSRLPAPTTRLYSRRAMPRAAGYGSSLQEPATSDDRRASAAIAEARQHRSSNRRDCHGCRHVSEIEGIKGEVQGREAPGARSTCWPGRWGVTPERLDPSWAAARAPARSTCRT